VSYIVDTSRVVDHNRQLVLIGCGGTGGFVAEGLCRLLINIPYEMVLVDPDVVEERNIARQNFYDDEVGMFKSEALAKRLSRQFSRPIAYAINPFANYYLRHNTCLLIGCVDTAMARKAIANTMNSTMWWVDAGNGDNWGQVIMGNCRDPRGISMYPKWEMCRGLPFPHLQEPGILTNRPASAPSCAQAVEEEVQSPLINQAMATLVLEVVRKMLYAELRWMRVYLDLAAGAMRPVPITPENIAPIFDVKPEALYIKEKGGSDGGNNHQGGHQLGRQ